MVFWSLINLFDFYYNNMNKIVALLLILLVFNKNEVFSDSKDYKNITKGNQTYIVGIKTSGVCITCEMKTKEIINYTRSRNIKVVFIADTDNLNELTEYFKIRNYQIHNNIEVIASEKLYQKYQINRSNYFPYFRYYKNGKLIVVNEITETKLNYDNSINILQNVLDSTVNNLGFQIFELDDTTDLFYYKSNGNFIFNQSGKITKANFYSLKIPKSDIIAEYSNKYNEYKLTLDLFKKTKNNKGSSSENTLSIKLLYNGNIYLNDSFIYMLCKMTLVKEEDTKTNGLIDVIESTAVILKFDKKLNFVDYYLFEKNDNQIQTSVYNFIINKNKLYTKSIYVKKDESFLTNSYDLIEYELSNTSWIKNHKSISYSSPKFFYDYKLFNKMLFPYYILINDEVNLTYQIYPTLINSNNSILIHEINDDKLNKKLKSDKLEYLFHDWNMNENLEILYESNANFYVNKISNNKSVYNSKIKNKNDGVQRLFYYRNNPYLIRKTKKDYTIEKVDY